MFTLDPQSGHRNLAQTVAGANEGFAICRILGNSLPPRHATGNTINNLQFILQNEESFEDAKKLWILNRLVDAGEAAEIKDIITSAGQEFIDIPFSPSAHYEAFLDVSGIPKPFEDGHDQFQNPVMATLRYEWMIRHKSLEIVNINHARNVALKYGRERAKWTLVLDGGVAFNRVGWDHFAERARGDHTSKFILIPMTRITTVSAFGSINANVYAGDEPQIAMRFDSEDLFNESLRYGNANKTELFKRIGFPGIWDSGQEAPWDKRKITKSKDAGLFSKAGLVIRLPTGAEGQTEISHQARWISRFEGVDTLSAQLDFAEATKRFDKSRVLHVYGNWNPKQAERLAAVCEDCMQDRILTVLDKRAIAPSGDLKDFICPPRYQKDHLATGSRLENLEVNDTLDLFGFDRFLRYSSILAYGGYVLGNANYSRRALEFLRAWTINEKTRMNPHLTYAHYAGQGSEPSPSGIVAARDLWLLPQTIDLLRASGVLEIADETKANWWCRQMLRGFSKSEQFQSALASRNSISTWAAATVASLSLHAGELESGIKLMRHVMVKFVEQVGHLNVQHFEMERERPLHYCLFNLAGWCALATILGRVGIDILRYKGQAGESLQDAIRLLSLTRNLFSDYRDDAVNFDERIEATMSLLGVTQTSESTISFMLNKDWGFAPLWPVLKPRENL